MSRRKEKINPKPLFIGILLIAATWLAAGYYYGGFGKIKTAPDSAPSENPKTTSGPVPAEKPSPSDQPAAESGAVSLRSADYKSAKYGFELQYPVLADAKYSCPKIKETSNGFSIGLFDFSVSGLENGSLQKYIDDSIFGMDIENKANITVAGQPAVKVDYQTAGMGFNGSSTFLEYGGKIFEFGLLANEASEKCGDIADYEDKIYQSVISTLKFSE